MMTVLCLTARLSGGAPVACTVPVWMRWLTLLDYPHHMCCAVGIPDVHAQASRTLSCCPVQELCSTPSAFTCRPQLLRLAGPQRRRRGEPGRPARGHALAQAAGGVCCAGMRPPRSPHMAPCTRASSHTSLRLLLLPVHWSEVSAAQFLARARRGRWWVQRVRCGRRVGY